jgi:hypothetical protein
MESRGTNLARENSHTADAQTLNGGEGGIRTLDPSFSPDNCLAGSPVRPLQHLSGSDR